MTLPSQFARPTSRHNHMYRRRRGGRRVFLGLLIALLLVVIGVWRWTGSDGGSAASALASDVSVPDGLSDLPEELPVNNQPFARESQGPALQPQRTTQREPEIRMGEPVSGQIAQQAAVETPAKSPEPKQEPPAPQAREASLPQAQPQRERVETQAPPIPPRQSVNPDRERALDRMRIGMELLASNRPIEARLVLTQALDSGSLDQTNEKRVRDTLSELNERLVFSPEIVAGDPYSFGYAIRSGDALSRLPRGQNLAIDWRFIQRVNRIARPEAIRAGQNIKLVTGPFHAVVYKRQFRMDVYLGKEGERVFVRSFRVGLGEYDSTPVGMFKVRPNSKLINPEWVNPRTGERFLPDDPMNPIGEHWIGLVGVSEGVRDLGGYGIHGTIEPRSIGQQASMGCIRMLADDVALVYELLVEEHSTIEIVDR